MTIVKFLADGRGLKGFEISGHCSTDGDDETGKIVCAAVSSAAYLTANTVTDVIGDEADAYVDEAKMYLYVKAPSQSSLKILEGLKLHLEELAGQYSNNITVIGGAK